jgi:FHA domain-containing protein
MEKIELLVEQRAGERLNEPWSAVFGLAGGTVGRGGQNKLILPDTEGEIARVHAMVRLGTNDAYIANLCERRPLTVDDLEVRPGEEVQLPLGACVGIGRYQIRVFALNQIGERVLSTRTTSDTQVASETTMPLAQIGLEAQSSLTNSRRDIHPQTIIATVAEPLPVFAEHTVGVESTEVHSIGATTTSQVLSNAFDLQRQEDLLDLRTQNGRPLVIPADFNPFEVVNRAQPTDEWGGLQTQSLTELAQHAHDGLIKALPLSGRLQDAMDNPVRIGLPKQLDPRQELDPLTLFADTSLVASPETSEITQGRSSELSHVFQLPKAQAASNSGHGVPSDLKAPLAGQNEASAEAVQAIQSVGLHAVQGLDLSLFGDGNTPLTAAPLADLPAPSASISRIPAQVPVMASPPTEKAEAPLQAFGLTLSGDVHAPVPPPPISSLQELTRPQVGHSPTLTVPPKCRAETPSSSLEVLAAAFLEGAGLTTDRVKLELTPEFMQAFGEAFRVAIEGSIDLLAARSEIKQEFRAGVTIIGSSANNPLKFLPNADGVIMQMVGQQFPGFMKPVPAIKEAFADLRVHQLALMAGIRAAYSEALTRFDPLKMEELAPRKGVLGKFYSSAHKAALWDEYKMNFTEIKNAAEDDMTAFSGLTFVNAYEHAASVAKGQA